MKTVNHVGYTKNKCELKNNIVRNEYEFQNIIVYFEDIFNTDAICLMKL